MKDEGDIWSNETLKLNSIISGDLDLLNRYYSPQREPLGALGIRTLGLLLSN